MPAGRGRTRGNLGRTWVFKDVPELGSGMFQKVREGRRSRVTGVGGWGTQIGQKDPVEEQGSRERSLPGWGMKVREVEAKRPPQVGRKTTNNPTPP